MLCACRFLFELDWIVVDVSPLSFSLRNAVEVQNDRTLEVTALKFKSYVSFWFGSNPQSFVGWSNLIKKVPHMERLLL